MVGTLADATGTALRARADALERASFVYHNGLNDHVPCFQLAGLIRVLGFPVGDGAAQELLQVCGCIPLGVVQQVQGVVNLLSADSIRHQAHLLRRSGDVVKFGDCGLLLGLFQALGHQSFSLSHNVNSLNITSYCCLRGL